MGLQKKLQNFASELGFKLEVVGGFQKGITLGGRISGSFHILCLQKWVAKHLQTFGSAQKVVGF